MNLYKKAIMCIAAILAGILLVSCGASDTETDGYPATGETTESVESIDSEETVESDTETESTEEENVENEEEIIFKNNLDRSVQKVPAVIATSGNETYAVVGSSLIGKVSENAKIVSSLYGNLHVVVDGENSSVVSNGTVFPLSGLNVADAKLPTFSAFLDETLSNFAFRTVAGEIYRGSFDENGDLELTMPMSGVMDAADYIVSPHGNYILCTTAEHLYRISYDNKTQEFESPAVPLVINDKGNCYAGQSSDYTLIYASYSAIHPRDVARYNPIDFNYATDMYQDNILFFDSSRDSREWKLSADDTRSYPFVFQPNGQTNDIVVTSSEDNIAYSLTGNVIPALLEGNMQLLFSEISTDVILGGKISTLYAVDDGQVYLLSDHATEWYKYYYDDYAYIVEDGVLSVCKTNGENKKIIAENVELFDSGSCCISNGKLYFINHLNHTVEITSDAVSAAAVGNVVVYLTSDGTLYASLNGKQTKRIAKNVSSFEKRGTAVYFIANGNLGFADLNMNVTPNITPADSLSQRNLWE